MESGQIKQDGSDVSYRQVQISDRRQPGRREEISPHLAPLLRKSERAEALLAMLDEAQLASKQLDADYTKAPKRRDLSDGPGIVLGVLLGGTIWVALLGAIGVVVTKLL